MRRLSPRGWPNRITGARGIDIGTTAYAGTPDYLKVILDKADELGVKLGITKAAVGGGALFPSLRQEYADRGVLCLQNYATADLGNVPMNPKPWTDDRR